MNYAPIILTNAGMGGQAALLSTIGLGSLKVVMTILAILQLETMGRRPLLLCGSVLCAVAMAMLGAAFTPTPALASLAVAGLVLFVGAWSASFGPLGWLLASELFPLPSHWQPAAKRAAAALIGRAFDEPAVVSCRDAEEDGCDCRHNCSAL